VLTHTRGGQIVQKGFDWRYSGVHWMAMGFHHLMYQAGGEMIRDGKPAFNSEAGVKALEVWKSTTVAPQVTKNTSASPFQDFANEQDAMTFIGPNGSRQAEGLNPKMKDNITVVPLPQINPAKPATMAYSFDIVVNAKIAEPKQRVAWDFVHMAVYDPKMWLSNNGSLLPYRAWAGSSEARQTLQFFDVFVHDLSIGRPMVRTDHFNEFEDAIGRAIQRAVFTGADPKQSLDQAATEFSRALKG
jgi:multiple sugar transport system substrate-binding protein